MFVYYTEAWPTAEDYIDPVTAKLEFKVREPDEYKDLDNYRKFLEVVLDKVVTPYVGPCCAARESLSRLGLVAEP